MPALAIDYSVCKYSLSDFAKTNKAKHRGTKWICAQIYKHWDFPCLPGGISLDSWSETWPKCTQNSLVAFISSTRSDKYVIYRFIFYEYHFKNNIFALSALNGYYWSLLLDFGWVFCPIWNSSKREISPPSPASGLSKQIHRIEFPKVWTIFDLFCPERSASLGLWEIVSRQEIVKCFRITFLVPYSPKQWQ